MKITIKTKKAEFYYDDSDVTSKITFYYSEHREPIKDLITHIVNEINNLK